MIEFLLRLTSFTAKSLTLIFIYIFFGLGSKWFKTCVLRQCRDFSEADCCIECFAKLL